MYVFQCEDSTDGILTGIYDAWASRYGHKNIMLSTDKSGEIMLFHQYIDVKSDFNKSQKVVRTLTNRLGIYFYETICKCAMADGNSKKISMDKANAIYQTVVMALALPEGPKVLEYLAEPCISCIFELCRQTDNEAHHMIEFIRFAELENKVLFAMIHPRNNVLPMVADHFSNRFPLENFLIYDATHRIAAVHKVQNPSAPTLSGSSIKRPPKYIIVDASDLNPDIIKRFSPEEQEYRKLWKAFFDAIAIEARINPKLQSNHIPKRYWKDTVEFANKT